MTTDNGFYTTMQAFVSADGQDIPVSAVIEIAGDKHFILVAKWSSKIKGMKRPIEYWYRTRKVQLTEHQLKTLRPFNIDHAKLRLD
jgi:hypothetical protein